MTDTHKKNQEGRPYIRLSEIPEKHKVFTSDAESLKPDGEEETCYDRKAYEKWQERWEGEGGQNVKED